VVDGVVSQVGEVDAGGAFGLVSECLADDFHGDVFAAGDACPGVAGYVGGEGDVEF
jgi:hypothetical protein